MIYAGYVCRPPSSTGGQLKQSELLARAADDDLLAPFDADVVMVRFTTTDGTEVGPLPKLSSRARFERFAHDFRHDEGDGICYDTVSVAGTEYVRLTRAARYEYLSKKDYLDSWYSEAHEKFCFFSPTDWTDLLEANGFSCTSDSRGIRNPWLIEHRFAPTARGFRPLPDGSLTPDDWSWTNVLIVAQKPI